MDLFPIFLKIAARPCVVVGAGHLAEAKIESLQKLAKCHAELVEKGVKSLSLVEGADDVAESILEVIDREQIDLLVISTHGASGWHPAAFGSVAQKLLKQAKCPVLLIRSTQAKAATVAA